MRLLLIEDDKRIASFIVKGLTEAGYAIDVECDGQKGLQTALSEPYDLLIVDWMLPGLDGVSICKKTRKNKPDLPIILVTAKDTIPNKVEGLEAGADDYLTKPFSFLELLARIRTLLRRGTRMTETLSIDDLTMNIPDRRVVRNGQEIFLSNKEFSILEYLLRNKNRVVSRVILTEHVWDIHFDRGTNLVDVYINYLRKKIDTGSKKSLIYTIRGAGYMLKES